MVKALRGWLVKVWGFVVGWLPARRQWRRDLDRCIAVGGTVARLLEGERLLEAPAAGKRSATLEEKRGLVARRLETLRQVAKIPGARFVPLDGTLSSPRRRMTRAFRLEHGLSARGLRRLRHQWRPQVLARQTETREAGEALERGMLPGAVCKPRVVKTAPVVNLPRAA